MSVLQNAAERKSRAAIERGAEPDRHREVTGPRARRRAPRWWRRRHRRADACETFRARGFAGFQAAAPLASIAGAASASVASSTASRIERAGMSISIRSPSSTRPIAPPSAASGETWPMREAGRAAGEAAVGDQRAGLAEAPRLQVARRIEHLLHARAAARALVADHHDVAGDDLAAEDALHRVVLALEDARRALRICGRSSSTPAVFTMQPSRAMLPLSTARPPSFEKACSASRMTPFSRSSSSDG